jgi:hypothetical protein
VVVFNVTVAPALAYCCKAEIKLPHILIGTESLGIRIEHDAAVFHDVAIIGDAQGSCGILLDQQDGDVLFAVQAPDNVEYFVNEERC